MRRQGSQITRLPRERRAATGQTPPPSTHPAMMPVVRSMTNVSPKVASSTAAVRQFRAAGAQIPPFSAMFQHTTTSTPASADSGTKLANGAATSMNSSRKTECIMPDSGLHAAGAHVGGGARDGAGDADAAEQG